MTFKVCTDFFCQETSLQVFAAFKTHHDFPIAKLSNTSKNCYTFISFTQSSLSPTKQKVASTYLKL